MADGEISVNVRADGVDEAAGDVAEEGGMGIGGGGDGGGGRAGELAQSIKGGIVGGLVASLLKPLLKVFEPFVKVIQAFVAPLAQMLLRLLTPVLRLFIGLLPAWYDFIDNSQNLLAKLLLAFSPLVQLLSHLPSIVNYVSELPGKLDTLASAISEFISKLPAKIIDLIPGLSPDTDTGEGETGPRTGRGEPSFPGGARGRPSTTDFSNPATARAREQTPGRDPVKISVDGRIAPLIDFLVDDRNIDIRGN